MIMAFQGHDRLTEFVDKYTTFYCNKIAICHGLNPDDIVYTGNIREELLSMVIEGKLRMPEYKERNSDPELEI